MCPTKGVEESVAKFLEANAIAQLPNDWSELPDEVAHHLLDEQTTLALFKCPICGVVITDATRVTKCLDLFCTDCIYGYVSQGHNSCPECSIDLGPNPEEFLAVDEVTTEAIVELMLAFELIRKMDALRASILPQTESEGISQVLPESSSVALMKTELSGKEAEKVDEETSASEQKMQG